MPMKKCRYCKVDVDYSNGVRHKGRSDGIEECCKECNKKRVRKWVEENKDKYIAGMRERAKRNSKQAVERVRQWRKKHKGRRNKYDNERYKTDPVHKLKVAIRNSIGKSIRRKRMHSKEMIGCDYDELKKHIQSQFTEGMTWNNYGEWHIDHIRPLSSFDLTNEEQQKQAFNYKNLQPLWAEDNRKKSNKYGKQ